ncbi:Signal transduction histidine kinase [Micromonospora matsumotoense]|uniref:Signal transduction histidine kinase n=1 Tax=Micromonospora matsumotoense TaxID=121616 RepID=A0A1C4Z7P9_9ACTN|nr:ATP-binding protein [Micromonospora matsumotoense]SCF28926.1 Signal transduction histidine kinase [Micromonospora matsumotoense]
MLSPAETVHGARGRAELLLIQASGALRAVQLSVGLPVLLFGGLDDFRSTTAIVGSHLSAVVWSAVLFTVMLRRRRVSLAWVLVDLALAAMWLITVPQMCVTSCASGWQLWTVPSAIGSIILAMVFIQIGIAAVGTLVVVGAYVLGIWEHVSRSGMPAPDALGSVAVNVFFMLGFALLAWLCAWMLRSSARQVDLATAEAIEARAREATARARYDERTRQYDVLHHTVLSTLSKIARGGLDHRDEAVRALCARDAEFLRGLMSGAAETGPSDFVGALAGVVRDKQALGLRVNSQFHALPATLPPAAASMLLGATREALTNVAKHANVDEAWLTAVGEGDGVRIVVVDRGVGFEQEAVPTGRGLIRELRHSVIETGGTVDVTSSPGHGTVVEVTWSN